MRVAAPLLSLAIICSGCATFDKIPAATGSPASSNLSAAVAIRGGETLAVADGTRQSKLSDEHRRAAERAIRESRAFSRIVQEGQSADYRVIVDVRKHQSQMYGGLTCLASGFLIPCTIDFRIVVTTRVETASASGASVVRSHTYRAWYDLLLLPYWSARSPFRHGVSVIELLVRNSLAEALNSTPAPSGTPRSVE